jgi:hypothetical protein
MFNYKRTQDTRQCFILLTFGGKIAFNSCISKMCFIKMCEGKSLGGSKLGEQIVM